MHSGREWKDRWRAEIRCAEVRRWVEEHRERAEKEGVKLDVDRSRRKSM